MEPLKYHLPTVGIVQAQLYGLAADCHELLQRYGHIQRLRETDQLGITRQIFEGAHHSRWEYVMTQLAVIHELHIAESNGSRIAKGNGLGSPTPFGIAETDRATGIEVMQCWALLLSSGHLHGTFATELAFLRFLRSDCWAQISIPFERLIEYLRPEAAEFVKRVLAEPKLYDVHKVLALLLLQDYRDEDEDLVRALTDLLSWYCVGFGDNSEKRENLRRIYRRVRQLVYLGLDSLYTSVPMQLDLGAVFHSLAEETGPDLCSVGDSPICDELIGFNELLAREIYFHPRVLLHYDCHARNSEKHIRKAWERKCNSSGSGRGLSALMKTLREGVPVVEVVPYEPVVYLPILPDAPFFSCQAQAEQLGEKIREACSSSGVRTSVLPDSSRPAAHVALGWLPSTELREVCECYSGLMPILERLAVEGTEIPEEILKDGRWPEETVRRWFGLYNSISVRCCPVLVEALLKWLSATHCTFTVDRRSEHICCLGPNTQTCAEVLALGGGHPNTDASRRHEIKTHAAALDRVVEGSTTLSVISPILVTDEEGNSVTDIDGLSIVCNQGNLSLLLVEAKKRRKSSASLSATQLNQRLEDMGLNVALEAPEVHPLPEGAFLFSPLKKETSQ